VIIILEAKTYSFHLLSFSSLSFFIVIFPLAFCRCRFVIAILSLSLLPSYFCRWHFAIVVFADARLKKNENRLPKGMTNYLNNTVS